MANNAPSSTYSWPPGPIASSTYGSSSPVTQKAFDLHGLSWNEAQNAIRYAAQERDAAIQRGRDERSRREAFLRRQGYDEAYIKRN